VAIAIIGDTHMPRGARRLPDECIELLEASELIVHKEAAGFQIFNPGSPTERRRAPRHSMGIAEIGADGALGLRHV